MLIRCLNKTYYPLENYIMDNIFIILLLGAIIVVLFIYRDKISSIINSSNTDQHKIINTNQNDKYNNKSFETNETHDNISSLFNDNKCSDNLSSGLNTFNSDEQFDMNSNVSSDGNISFSNESKKELLNNLSLGSSKYNDDLSTNDNKTNNEFNSQLSFDNYTLNNDNNDDINEFDILN